MSCEGTQNDNINLTSSDEDSIKYELLSKRECKHKIIKIKESIKKLKLNFVENVNIIFNKRKKKKQRKIIIRLLILMYLTKCVK
jgi:hypothetical protein